MEEGPDRIVNRKNYSKNLTLKDLQIQRGETQKNVNYEVLKYLAKTFRKEQVFKGLDLPCGTMLFLTYLRTIFPKSELCGADIRIPESQEAARFIAMDLTKEFTIHKEEKFDVITSISGIMMFGNTSGFVSNCSTRLKKDGHFIITNDNSATIIDKLSFLFLGRYRIFKPMYEDSEQLTQNIPIQEVCRLLRINGLVIEKIKFSSFYIKDLVFLPLAVLLYPIQLLYLWRYKTGLPENLKWQMFSFKHYFCKHYIIITRKV
jgi:Methyltransferase domain